MTGSPSALFSLLLACLLLAALPLRAQDQGADLQARNELATALAEAVEQRDYSRAETLQQQLEQLDLRRQGEMVVPLTEAMADDRIRAEYDEEGGLTLGNSIRTRIDWGPMRGLEGHFFLRGHLRRLGPSDTDGQLYVEVWDRRGAVQGSHRTLSLLRSNQQGGYHSEYGIEIGPLQLGGEALTVRLGVEVELDMRWRNGGPIEQPVHLDNLRLERVPAPRARNTAALDEARELYRESLRRLIRPLAETQYERLKTLEQQRFERDDSMGSMRAGRAAADFAREYGLEGQSDASARIRLRAADAHLSGQQLGVDGTNLQIFQADGDSAIWGLRELGLTARQAKVVIHYRAWEDSQLDGRELEVSIAPTTERVRLELPPGDRAQIVEVGPFDLAGLQLRLRYRNQDMPMAGLVIEEVWIIPLD